MHSGSPAIDCVALFSPCHSESCLDHGLFFTLPVLWPDEFFCLLVPRGIHSACFAIQCSVPPVPNRKSLHFQHNAFLVLMAVGNSTRTIVVVLCAIASQTLKRSSRGRSIFARQADKDAELQKQMQSMREKLARANAQNSSAHGTLLQENAQALQKKDEAVKQLKTKIEEKYGYSWAVGGALTVVRKFPHPWA